MLRRPDLRKIVRHVFRQSKDYQYQSNVVESAVAIIYRCPQQEPFSWKDIEILLMRRTVNPKDVYSGEICFPGGRQDNNQPLLQTAIRETKQELGIILNNDNYVTQVGQRFFANQLTRTNDIKPKVLFTRAYIFENSNDHSQISMSPAQASAWKWVSLRTLMDSQHNFTHRKSNIFGRLLKALLQKHKNIDAHKVQSCFRSISYPAIEVGLNDKLYGLTFFIMLTIMERLRQQIVKSKKKQFFEFVEAFNKLHLHSKTISIDFSEDSAQLIKWRQIMIQEYLGLRSLQTEIGHL